jgi:cytochrome c oxidase cbb3-type subunit 3
MTELHKQPDGATGPQKSVQTTGHVWDDDIRELDTPLPLWWLYTFYACIVWSVGCWILYPSWPTLQGYTMGVLGVSDRSAVATELAAAKQSQETFRKQLASASATDVRNNPELLRFAMASGGASFQTNCAPCHGRGAQGFVGYPNLNDDDWLWGGTLEDIETTLLYGIRSGHAEARVSQMPRYGVDGILSPAEIDAVTNYVRGLAKLPVDQALAQKGSTIFAEQCASCHGETGQGNAQLGAPNLADAIWLYGSSPEAVTQTIVAGRNGVMPGWIDRLDRATIKSLAVYVHSLGGGQLASNEAKQ